MKKSKFAISLAAAGPPSIVARGDTSSLKADAKNQASAEMTEEANVAVALNANHAEAGTGAG